MLGRPIEEKSDRCSELFAGHLAATALIGVQRLVDPSQFGSDFVNARTAATHRCHSDWIGHAVYFAGFSTKSFRCFARLSRTLLNSKGISLIHGVSENHLGRLCVRQGDTCLLVRSCLASEYCSGPSRFLTFRSSPKFVIGLFSISHDLNGHVFSPYRGDDVSLKTIHRGYPYFGICSASRKKCGRPRPLSPRVNIKRVIRRRNSRQTPQMAAGYFRHAV